MDLVVATHPKLDVILGKLVGVKRNGSNFVARCPAHEDKSPSLSVTLGRKWIVYHCFAGCDRDAIRRALGLEWKDLVLDDSEPAKRATKRRDLRAIELEALACAARLQHEPEVLNRLRFGDVLGVNEDAWIDGKHPEIRNGRGWSAKALGDLDVGWDGSRLTLIVRTAENKLHDVLRYDPFTRTGRKVLAGKGKSRLPWPAPEYLDPKRALFLVEGEGTAISMATVGFQAVALPGSVPKPTTSIQYPGRWQGAGWHPKWANRFARFRNVIAFPDCDAQGRALMSAASYDLAKAGVNARIVDIGPKATDGRDIADHLLTRAWGGPSRRIARDVIRVMVAEEAEVLAA